MIEQLESDPSSSGLAWLLEHEVVNNSAVLNALVLNVYKLADGITDVQFVIDSHGKKLLVYVETTRWTRWFHLSKVERAVLEVLDQALPTFRKRVTFDREILRKSVELANGTKPE